MILILTLQKDAVSLLVKCQSLSRVENGILVGGQIQKETDFALDPKEILVPGGLFLDDAANGNL